jgi:hypothetical protein
MEAWRWFGKRMTADFPRLVQPFFVNFCDTALTMSEYFTGEPDQGRQKR